ncbi:GNAT family N-acetyltransferase [Erwinia persicina]|uniref:GNAT family N-acetyltransferase n=1 Tax=Erwinia persicina TaxID=55211 RepID=UPI0017844C84|nr:GNAT family N-acetyltransferase [Erwinia persicina]MBD8164502.1 GNAT family N-acetyltransferase [Erwinia persicina]MBD8213459.1 GNAT family N-acetyltransferase [Erwinia persicina]
MLKPVVPVVAEWQRDEYLLSSDTRKLDIAWVHAQLAEKSYWAAGQSLATTERSLAASMPFGLYYRQQQVGFGRLITDYSRFAYLSDVMIDDAHRGKGLGRWFAATVLTHPELQTIKRWMLATDDAHDVYRRAGWQPVAQPQRLMEFIPTPPEDNTP